VERVIFENLKNSSLEDFLHRLHARCNFGKLSLQILFKLVEIGEAAEFQVEQKHERAFKGDVRNLS